jgi:HAD superfamily hydrolase (TIGR01490 family)
MNLAVFDFDGTLTTKDSLFEFLKFHHGFLRMWAKLCVLFPVMLLYWMGIIPNWKAKEILLVYFFNGTPTAPFLDTCRRFSDQIIPTILREEAMKKLAYHQEKGDRTLVISASVENWLHDWCQKQKLELLATKIKFSEGKVTGKIQGKNCYGIEKVNRLKEYLDLSDYQEVYVYGDSKGDRELLSIASRPFYRRF